MTTEWTPDEMASQAGRTVVVTGANSGLGYEASRVFAAKGAHVVLACRSVERGEAARDDIAADYPGASLTVSELDLADLDSVRAFAERFRTEHDALHVLCNNAGVMATPRTETADGFETQFGVNHLGHYALTAGLLPVLRATSGETRVVTQSSGLHERGVIDFDDLQGEADYDRWDAYAQSKLANLLFAYELDRRLRAANASVTSVGCHPGFANTNLQNHGDDDDRSGLRRISMWVATKALAQSAEHGAWPLLYAASDPSVDGGEYVGPGGLLNVRGHPTVQRSSDRSYDRADARRLWSVSSELTGASYDLPTPDPN